MAIQEKEVLPSNEKIVLEVGTYNEDFFNIVAEDGHMLAQPIQKDTLQVAPGETYDLTFYAWAPPGSIYPFHCHILSHLMNPGQTGEEMGGLIVLIEYAK